MHVTAMGFAVVATGNHYLLDIGAGLLVLGLALAVCSLPAALAASLRASSSRFLAARGATSSLANSADRLAPVPLRQRRLLSCPGQDAA